MEVSRRHAFLLISLAAAVAAVGCSSSSEPAAEAPSVASVAPVEPTPTIVPTPTVAPSTPELAGSEPVYRGVLREQHCAVDNAEQAALSVHSGPSSQDPIVTTLAPGQCRIFLREGLDPDWYEVVVDLDDDELRGWVSIEGIAPQRVEFDPEAPMVVITIDVEYELDYPASEAPINAFRLVDADGFVVGFLDANGQIEVPTRFPVARARIEAEFADDPYCSWSGEPSYEGFDDRYTSLLEAICA